MPVLKKNVFMGKLHGILAKDVSTWLSSTWEKEDIKEKEEFPHLP